jgi:hypothetical protein
VPGVKLLVKFRCHATSIREGTAAALSLAFDCAELGTELAPELRQRLDELITSDPNPRIAR